MDRLIEDIKKIWRNLVSLYVYKTLNADIYIILIKTMDFKKFDDLKKILKWKKFIMLTLDDIENGADIFALKFLNIKNNSDLLFWKDILKNIKIKKSDLRQNIEYELRTKLIQLREWFLSTWWHSDFVKNIFPVMLPIWEWIVVLFWKKIWDGMANINTVDKVLWLNSTFLKVLFITDIKPSWSDLSAFIQDFNSYLIDMVHKIDNHK